MKYLKKTWIRIIISLLVGGFIYELIYILLYTPNEEEPVNLSWLFAVIIYFTLTFMVYKNDQKKNKQNPG